MMRPEIIVIWNILMIFGSSMSSKKTISSSELWKFHLKLYRNHCGDVVLCDNVTGHLEPLELLTPLPCCLPCSCLPTCRMRHNCCPDIGYHTENVTDTETTSVELEPNHAEQLTDGEDVDVSANQSTGQTTVWKRSQSFNPAKSRTKRSQENQFDRKTIRTRTSNDAKHVPTFADDKILEMTNVRETDLDTVCIRPQVLYEPNVYLDSKAYKMVAVCKETFQDSKIVAKCHDATEKTDISEMMPVTSRHTGLTYVNKFCLMCNEAGTLDAAAIDVWDAKIIHYANVYRDRFVFNPNELIDNLSGFRTGHGNIHFVPRSSNLVQQCETYDVSSCNQTGLWEIYDEMTENTCHHGHSLPILHLSFSYRRESLRFKNIACVHCNLGNTFKDISLFCRNSVNLDYNEYDSYSFSQILNIKDTNPDRKTENGLIHVSYTDKAVLQLPKTKLCPSGYIALLGRCRQVICPRGQYISNNKCVPLYQSITGMDLNVKIDVFLSEAVPKKFSSDFLDKLMKIVNISLSEYVTLQPRDISVWYGPKQRKPPYKFYMFDIYLFNASDMIDYSTAVKEIRDFFNNLKSYKNLSFSDGTEIGLDFKFDHRMEAKFQSYNDISVPVGGGLRPLVGELSDHRPNMFISNVNWCYRVAFHEAFQDLERIDRKAYVIKHANITVYEPQYDKQYKGNFQILYLCLDLFISHANNDYLDLRPGNLNGIRQQNVVIASVPHDEDNNDIAEGTAPISVIIVSVLFTLILVIGLFKISFASKTQTEQTEQTAVQAGSDVISVDESAIQKDDKKAEMVCQETVKEQNNLVDNNSINNVSQAQSNLKNDPVKPICTDKHSSEDLAQDNDCKQ